ncbi:hypothetical protein N7466_001550 [Penicillium verhagenii]|uniref:uncharacterized protein n=1 Tax=Penicillium verhagenii TaxID=1562060 RepID=UPI0025453E30|nr:uncharacterized protein N7466_001550 [Penicillium verhagenii]KAJ5938416.1 hypothetical protein N7466_001550 [Penicillium verhagenii]
MNIDWPQSFGECSPYLSASAETPTTSQVYTIAPIQHTKVIQLPASHTDNNPHETNFGSADVICLSNSASSEIIGETSEY